MVDFTNWPPLKIDVLTAFRHIVPKPEDRIALTWTTAWSQILYLFPVFYMAYLARRPDTYHIRLAILPWALYSILRGTYGYAWIDPQFVAYNWARSIIYIALLLKVVEYGLTPVGILRKGEIKPGLYPHDYQPPLRSPTSDLPVLHAPRCIADSIHLIQSFRGLNYQFSEGVHIPSPTRPQSPASSFFLSTLSSLLINFLCLDLLAASMKHFFPLVSQLGGGTIFDPSLPVYPIPWRYIASTMMTCITAFAMEAELNMGYDFLTLIGVGLCGQQAEDWPPLMDYPWHSDSLHVYWGRRWHQAIRRGLIVLGGYPAQSVTRAVLSLLGVNARAKKKAGDVAVVLGVFIACGLYHEGTAYTMGQGSSHWGWIFYATQGPLMIGERLWKQITGRPVRGRWGTFWVALVLLVGPQNLFNSWHERGFGASMFVPPLLSPAEQVIFPALKIVLAWVGVEGIFRKIVSIVFSRPSAQYCLG